MAEAKAGEGKETRRLLAIGLSSFLTECLTDLPCFKLFQVERVETVATAVQKLQEQDWPVVLCGVAAEQDVYAVLERVKTRPQAFCIVFNPLITGHSKRRLQCFAAGAKMLANDVHSIRCVLGQISSQWAEKGAYACPFCAFGGLTETSLHLHDTLYHSVDNVPKVLPCPICKATKFPTARGVYAIHLHNEHGPVDKREPLFPSFAAFSLVVCRRKDGKFLMVNEPAAIAGGAPNYWLPAGRVDAGETFVQAAIRETEEEGGIKARIVGVLHFSLSSLVPRVTFLAEPVDDTAPKSICDWESCGALWVEADELKQLTRAQFRASDPLHYFPKVASGELKNQPLDTKPFAELETLISTLTTEKMQQGEKYADKFGARITAMWDKLKTTYPSVIEKD